MRKQGKKLGNCVHCLIVVCNETINSDKGSIDISNTFKLLNLIKKSRKYPLDIRVSGLIPIFGNGRKTGPRQQSLFPDAEMVRMGFSRTCI